MPPRHAASAATATTTWLDELPDEVCARVAAFVTRGAQGRDALNLAHASAKQGRAVVSTLSHKLIFDFGDARQVAQWADLLAGNVREVNVLDWHLVFMSRFRVRANRSLLRLLAAPTLRAAEIAAEAPFLRAIRHAGALRTLRVHLHSGSPSALLVDALASLALDDLTLECNGSSADDCAFVCLPCFRRSPDVLARACPRLRALEVRCFCDGRDSPLWDFLPTLPNLREARLTSAPPDHALPALQSLDAVQISQVQDGKHLAKQLAPAVTKLSVQDESLDADDVLALQNSPKLLHLAVILSDGVELLLLDAVNSTPNLRSLDLMFESSVFDSQPRYYEPAPGAMKSMVMRLPDLERLSFSCMRLERSEVNDILKSVGPRLNFLRISCDGQEEPELSRLEAVLRTAIRHNSGLQSFFLRRWMYEAPLEPEAEGFQEEKEQRSRLADLIRLLKERAPLLDDSDLDAVVVRGECGEDTCDGGGEIGGPWMCLFCCAYFTIFPLIWLPAQVIVAGHRACKTVGRAIRSCWRGRGEP